MCIVVVVAIGDVIVIGGVVVVVELLLLLNIYYCCAPWSGTLAFRLDEMLTFPKSCHFAWVLADSPRGAFCC